MAEDSKGPVQVLKHPLFLLIVGSIIGSLLVPWINRQSDKSRVLREARLKKAIQIVDNNTRMQSQINSLMTRLGIFHKDNIRLKPSPAKLGTLKDQLAENMIARYAQFEETAWWWYGGLKDEAVILQILPPCGTDKLQHDVDAYGKNVYDTVKALEDFWHICLSTEYDFTENGKVTQIQTKANERLKQLADERVALVNNLVQDFNYWRDS